MKNTKLTKCILILLFLSTLTNGFLWYTLNSKIDRFNNDNVIRHANYVKEDLQREAEQINVINTLTENQEYLRDEMVILDDKVEVVKVYIVEMEVYIIEAIRQFYREYQVEIEKIKERL